MTVSNLPIYPQVIKDYAVQILAADTSSLKTIATGGANGTKIDSLIASSSDNSANRDVTLYKTIGGTDYLLGTVTIPVAAGTVGSISGNPSIDLLANLAGLAADSNGNKDLYLASGTTLRIKSTTTVTTSKQINIVGSGGDY